MGHGQIWSDWWHSVCLLELTGTACCDGYQWGWRCLEVNANFLEVTTARRSFKGRA